MEIIGIQNSLNTAYLEERNFKMKLLYSSQSACRHLYLSVRPESSNVMYEVMVHIYNIIYTWNKKFYTTTTTTTSNITKLINPWY